MSSFRGVELSANMADELFIGRLPNKCVYASVFDQLMRICTFGCLYSGHLDDPPSANELVSGVRVDMFNDLQGSTHTHTLIYIYIYIYICTQRYVYLHTL